MSERSSSPCPTYRVYKHTCIITGKSYVGYTKYSMEYRWLSHVRAACHSTLRRPLNYFQRAIKKHGVDSWTHVVLVDDIASKAEACELEIALIANHGTLAPNGYNSTRGGDRVDLTPMGREYHRQRTCEALHKPDVRRRYLDGVRRGHRTFEFLERNRIVQKIAQSRDDVREKKRLSMLAHAKRLDYVNPRSKSVEQIDDQGNIINTFRSATEAGKITNTNVSHLCEVARGLRPRAGGYVWRYVVNDKDCK